MEILKLIIKEIKREKKKEQKEQQRQQREHERMIAKINKEVKQSQLRVSVKEDPIKLEKLKKFLRKELVV